MFGYVFAWLSEEGKPTLVFLVNGVSKLIGKSEDNQLLTHTKVNGYHCILFPSIREHAQTGRGEGLTLIIAYHGQM